MANSTTEGWVPRFKEPSLDPIQIQERFGRSLVDIRKYQMALRQREKKEFREFTDVDRIKKLRYKAQRLDTQNFEALQGYLAKTYDKYGYNPPERVRLEMWQHMQDYESKGQKMLADQNQYEKEILEFEKNPGKYDWDTVKKNIKEFERTAKYPAGGILAPVDISKEALAAGIASEIKPVPTGEYSEEDIGQTVVVMGEQAYRIEDIRNLSEGAFADPRVKRAFPGGMGELVGMVEERLAPPAPVRAGVRTKRKEEEEVDFTKGWSTDPKVKLNIMGAQDTIRAGRDLRNYTYRTEEMTEISGFAKKYTTFEPRWIIQHVDIETEDIQPGESIGEAVGRNKEVGTNLIKSLQLLEDPQVEILQVYRGDEIEVLMKIEPKKAFGVKVGKKKETITIKSGDPVSEEVYNAMTPEQQAMVEKAPFVRMVGKTAAYGNVEALGELTRGVKNKFGLTDKAYDYFWGKTRKVKEETGTGGLY